jgi:2,4-dichlorophenol 6-monooxygenase
MEVRMSIRASVEKWPQADSHLCRRDSPEVTCNLPLLRSEPIFRKLAEERNPGRVLFSHTVTELEDKGGYVLVTVQGPNGTTQDYHAQYVVAADGGKLSAAKLGVKMEGPTGLVDFVSTHFRADLSKYWDGGSRQTIGHLTDH